MNPTTDTLAEIADRIVRALAPEKIWLFGSHAWGSPNADSDLDLYIVVHDEDEPSYRIARKAYKALRGISVPIDILIRTRAEFEQGIRAPSSLESQITEKGVALYG